MCNRGNGGPPAIAVILITVFYVRGESVTICFFACCVLSLKILWWTVCICCWLSFRLSKILQQTIRNSRRWASYFSRNWTRFGCTCIPKILAAYCCDGLCQFWNQFKKRTVIGPQPSALIRTGQCFKRANLTTAEQKKRKWQLQRGQKRLSMWVCVCVIACMDIFRHTIFIF